MSERLQEALDHIDQALDILRECVREGSVSEDLVEEVIYYLEEAGERLNSLLR